VTPQQMDQAIKKTARLLDVLVQEHGKVAALLDEIHAVLGGHAGIGQKMRTVTDAFSAAWEVRHRSPYLWDGKRDFPSLKRLLKTLSAEDVAARAMLYIRDDDAFYVTARHPFRLFLTNINRYAPEGHDAIFDALDQEAAETAALLKGRAR
jgi:hypothetical protein